MRYSSRWFCSEPEACLLPPRLGEGWLRMLAWGEIFCGLSSPVNETPLLLVFEPPGPRRRLPEFEHARFLQHPKNMLKKFALPG